MTWADYVSWTATTALPVTANPEYIRLGVLEEAHECLVAYSALQAAIFGHQKRVLRGDAEIVLQAKEEAIAKARAQLLEELGDLAWYVARMGCQRKPLETTPNTLLIRVAEELEYFSDRPDALNAMGLFARMLNLSGIALDVVIQANVAKLTARKSSGTIKREGSR